MTHDTLTTDLLDPPEDYAPVDAPPESAADEPALAEAGAEQTDQLSPAPRTTVKLPPASEQPYVAGECTVTITLTLPPGDGPALIGVRSHDGAPLLTTLPRSELPDVLRVLLERHLARLPELAAQAEAEKARRASRSKPSAAKSSKPKPATPAARKDKPADQTPPPIPQRDLFAEFDQRGAAPSTPTSTP